MESIALADVSLPSTSDREVQIPLSITSISSLFPAAKSVSGSSDSSLCNQSLIADFSPSIPYFFPQYNSQSSSESAPTKQISPYFIPSLFPPNQSQPNSVSSDKSLHEFDHSIPSIFEPNYSYSPSDESTHQHHLIKTEEYHVQWPDHSIPSIFEPNYSYSPSDESTHQHHLIKTEEYHVQWPDHSIPSIFEPNYSYSPSDESTHHHHLIKTEEYHVQWPNITGWRSIKFNFNVEEEKIFPRQVVAALNQASERWTYAIYWESNRPSNSPLGHTWSPVKGFYNVCDSKFKDKAVSFFQLRESWPDNLTFGSILRQVFRSSIPIWRVGEDCLASSLYYRPRQGHKNGLRTMSWIRMADGVMEFGSTELIHRA